MHAAGPQLGHELSVLSVCQSPQDSLTHSVASIHFPPAAFKMLLDGCSCLLVAPDQQSASGVVCVLQPETVRPLRGGDSVQSGGQA
jgi:hypothetical protein